MNSSPQPIELTNWKPRFFAIWGGQAVSLVGSALTQFVLVWWVTQHTGSAGALATAGVMSMLPVALFSPLGGAVADRFSRRLIMILSDAITAACMLVLILLFAAGSIQLWHIYSMMAVRAIMHAFQRPAAAASTANLVPADWLQRVAGMNQALEGLMTIAAAPLGALALAALPTQGALSIDLVTALLGILPLFFFKIPQPKPQAHTGQPSLLHDMLEGARYVLHRRGLLVLYSLTGLVVLTVMPCFVLTPLLVTGYFQGGVSQVAVMEAFAGVGIILGGLLLGVWKIPLHRVALIMISFAISCGTVALTALAPPGMFYLAVFWWFVSGVSYSTGNAPMFALLQAVIPNEMQGRTLALLSMVFGIAGPLGMALAGPIGETLGVRMVFILGGAVSAVLNLLALLFPSLWNLERDTLAERAAAALPAD